MDEMEVLEMEQTTLEQAQEPTTQEAEQETIQELTQEQTEQELEQEHQTDASLISNMPDMSDNAIHEMFYAIGVNLDYVPQSEGEMFTLGVQAVCALFFIWLFFKTLFQFIREFGKGI